MDWDLGLIVLGLTGVAKEFGVRGKWLTLTAVLVGMAVSLLWNLWPDGSRFVFDGLVLALTCAGLYGITKATGKGIIERIKK